MEKRTEAYDLYLDESGTFMETSSVQSEQDQARQQPFPSQLAGVLVPRDALTESVAREILAASHKAAGLPYNDGDEVHGKALSPGPSYDTLIRTLIAQLHERDWQPVRLVNREGVSYGDRVAMYTNMVAGLVLRICLQKHTEGQSRLSIRPCCAIVKIGENAEGSPVTLQPHAYEKRLAEYLAMTAVRRGYAAESARWKTEAIRIRSGRQRPEWQICDLLSNASHADYRKCSPEVGAALKAAFGVYDQTLVIRELLERVDQLLDERSFGLALITLAEQLVQDETSRDVQVGARERLRDSLAQLAVLVAPVRDAQLSLLLSWLAQIIDLQRSLDVGYAVAGWLQREVEARLRERLGQREREAEVDWFAYALQRWALTASNHRGALLDARAAAAALDDLTPKLAGHWEHATLLMEGLVAQAVHRTDCFAFADASARMRIVAGYYGELSGLFSVAMPEVFPDRIRSNLRAKALGTWLQSEIYAGVQHSERLAEARRVSELAIEEFSREDDKARQYQYRCQLETVAGDFPAAREYLARSLHLPENSHAAIAMAIQGLAANPFGQGFSLLHWFRLGTTSFLTGQQTEWNDFLHALTQARLLHTGWCRGEMMDYPVHGILRHTALIAAAQGQRTEAQTALANLRNLDPVNNAQIILGAVQLAAYVEAAALLWVIDQHYARRLLDSADRERPGLRQLLKTMQAKTAEQFPQLWQVLAPWPGVIDEVLQPTPSPSAVRDKLLALGRMIGY